MESLLKCTHLVVLGIYPMDLPKWQYLYCVEQNLSHWQDPEPNNVYGKFEGTRGNMVQPKLADLLRVPRQEGLAPCSACQVQQTVGPFMLQHEPRLQLCYCSIRWHMALTNSFHWQMRFVHYPDFRFYFHIINRMK